MTGTLLAWRRKRTGAGFSSLHAKSKWRFGNGEGSSFEEAPELRAKNVLPAGGNQAL
jgi:hypothetical protein